MTLRDLQEMTMRYPGILKITLRPESYDQLLVQCHASSLYPINPSDPAGPTDWNTIHFYGAEGEVIITRETPFVRADHVDHIDGTQFTAGAIIEGPK